MAHHSDEEIQMSLAVLLLDYLKELSDEEQKEFKWNLSHMGVKPIPRGQVMHLDKMDVIDMMIGSYSEEGALKVTLEILKKMNLNDLAQRLKKHLWKCNQAGSELCDIFQKRELMPQCQQRIKCNLKEKFERVFEGKAKEGHATLLNEIYTELYITEGGTGAVNDEHEVRQIEATLKKRLTEDTTVKCNDIFKPLSGRLTPIRTVLTKGVAGIGKTVSVQKFILDWAEGKANQQVHFIFALPFRDLNSIKDKYSLIELLCHFVPDLKSFDANELCRYKILIIFDGLDECRLPLDFQNNESWFDVTKKTSLDVLFTNLITGNLLPSALLWVTSRPAAANQIPPECIHRVTEIRGFNDSQKEEYFRKRFSDQNLACRIITHVKSSRALFIMCHIPVFCWISATVLERLFIETDSGEIPKTLTEMYTHFLIFQTSLKNDKYRLQTPVTLNRAVWYRKLMDGCMINYETRFNKCSKSGKKFLLKLGKLAFQNLKKGNLIFYEQDLTENDIDVTEASVYSGVCTEVFKEEFGLYQEKVYCFVHLSIQEYLAALYVFVSNSSADLLKTAVDEALESKNGHLDLYLRFLLGLSTNSSKTLIQRLMAQKRIRSQNINESVQYIKKKIQENLSPERTINLFHCLNEVGDNSLVEEVQRYLNSGSLSARDLTPAQYSALAFVLLMSDEELDVFDLKKFITSDEGRQRLLPVIKNSRTALLNSCNLTEKCCEALASALRSNSPPLRELDLSDNDLQDLGVQLLSAGLGDSHCNLEILRLSGCRVTEKGCSILASALKSNASHLRELDLSYNDLGDSGVKRLFAVLEASSCRLEKLKVDRCELTEECCEAMASALRSSSLSLRELDLSDNDLQDSGVQLLSAGLGDSHCNLEILRLSGCRITERGCSFLASALRSNPSYLRELHLSYNHPGDSGVKLLSAVLEDSSCRLEKLNLDHGEECRTRPRFHKYSCQLTLDPNTAYIRLSLSEGNRKVTCVAEEQSYPDHPERFICCQILCRESLTGRCYWEAEWSADRARIGVTYKGIGRKETSADCVLGHNDKSWILCCSPHSYSVWHNHAPTYIPIQPSGSRRVGVYLNWEAGTLSFYRVSSDRLTLLYNFTSSFTEPLYPGFYIYQNSSLSLSMLG
ncbi:NACHT, LRR and PYD domains-containing protein 12-like isoform X1 [Brienomyrus brachyistius]|uniref:NACHT, LRR and PYD domains-containing protein 12-like isoform X1 n=2 Tax=Brienomyrus brachyistius TaxID=42636 RepID=UPI0020B37A92|nr:NACHT, LRR and PYD domains-containing protein 12-like isoform X1 [Brienomyrus brachyistius]XP_048868803.1 NACHT, LRR and PYD domains-containing protein 12-like isoform X1 [Brienomyrus brachyistius]XP_048868804.1 NACHT, LRR and PYD domains-containing protein 12-like isoform X1 [Brienomyrus brachyistius]XP_048868805.1 NACHT, LRR and PYD domains-containing protein 12-like isoform X1 [Brienomyrus brachyistius]